MVLTSDKERVKTLLKDTVTLLCKNGLAYKSSFRIEGLIGITIDEEDVFLINLNESFGSDSNTNATRESPNLESAPVNISKTTLTASRGKRKKRPQKHTPNHIDSSMPSPVSGYDQLDDSPLVVPTASERLDLPTVTLQDLQSGGNLWDVGSNCGSESTDGASPAKRMAFSSDAPQENGSKDHIKRDGTSSLVGLVTVKPEPVSDEEGFGEAVGGGQFAPADVESEHSPSAPIPVRLMPAGSGMSLSVVANKEVKPWETGEEAATSDITTATGTSNSTAKQSVHGARVGYDVALAWPGAQGHPVRARRAVDAANKPWQCHEEGCGKKFFQSQHLRRHGREKHNWPKISRDMRETSIPSVPSLWKGPKH